MADGVYLSGSDVYVKATFFTPRVAKGDPSASAHIEKLSRKAVAAAKRKIAENAVQYALQASLPFPAFLA